MASLCEAHQIVGAAFEHLLRLELQRLNPMAELGHCLAAYVVDSAEDIVRNGSLVSIGTAQIPNPVGKGLVTIYSPSSNPEKDLQQLRKAYQHAENHSNEYIQKGLVTHDLLVSCWMIAKIIGSFRAGRKGGESSVLIPYGFSNVDERGMNEMAKMFSLINRDIFRAREACLLRPVFHHDPVPGGLQPDFVIDDMLVDVKCTSRKGLDRRDIDQLLGYYALSKIKGLVAQKPERTINRLGIYYARFAQMFVIDVRKDFPAARVTKFLEWFEQRQLGKV